jgi:uncharacterized protein YbaR (Trm112 family)
MFIELAEVLRCPQAHEGVHYCVLVPRIMNGRHVLAGDVACPACKATYPISDGVADLRDPDDTAPIPPVAGDAVPSAEDVAALLGVRGPGGYVALVGSAAYLAAPLATLLEGVHLILVNAPREIPLAPSHSCVTGGRALPLASAVVRGVVIGAEHAAQPWLAEGVRLLLSGLRMVVLREEADVVGLSVLASGQGMTVGVRE